MYSDTKHQNDRFTFSLRGMRAVSSYAMVPAIADNGINEAWDARLRERNVRQADSDQADPTRQLETLLARYFAPGCRCST